MGRDGSGKKQHLHQGIISRSGVFRPSGSGCTASSDRLVSIAGRQARHDGIAMCLLRKDIVQAMPMRRVHRVARNRRLLVLVWILVVLWWILGWISF